MPEVPDLEAIRGFLNQRIVGQVVERADVLIPIVIRIPRDEFVRMMVGDRLGPVVRQGKFLIFSLDSGRLLVINPMLTGRFAYVEPSAKKHARTCLALGLSDGHELRYVDQRVMGRIYLVTKDELTKVPQLAEMGPDVLSPGLSREVFDQRIRRFSGQIKSVLTNHRFIAGIGNAYSDEILWEAGLHPYKRRASMSDEEVGRLYQAVHSVYAWAGPIVAEKMTESLDYSEWRDHLRVHRRGGQACPRCGATISEITAGQRITSFCRQCQPSEPRGA